MKITAFADVPKMIQHGSWECDYRIHDLNRQIDTWVDEDGLILDPDFQRGRVWTSRQQQKFLEFFLRGGKTARVIYLNKPSWNIRATTEYDDFVVVDGLQRLLAVREFLDNRLKVFDSYFREFTDRPRIHETFRVNVNDLQTRPEVLEWYLQFNAGGTPHTEDELDRVRKLLKEAKKCS